MRQSSIIFVGGFTLVFGFFAAESYDADAEALRLAEIRASQMQADLMAEAGCYIASYAAAQSDFGSSAVTMNGGLDSITVTVTAWEAAWPYYPYRASVVSKARFGEITVVKRANLEKRSTGSQWRQWVIRRMYTDPYTLADPTLNPSLANSTRR